MPTSVIQLSFAGGEVAPELYGRADQAKYQTGLAQCINFIVQRFGTITNRAGTTYLGPCAKWLSGGKESRLLPFVFSSSVTYVLELSDLVARLIQNGAYVLVAPTAWNSGTAYTVGDLASSGGVNYYCIQAHTNQAPPNASYWFAMTGSYLEIPTPWVSADLALLQTVQSADVVTVAHQSYQPYEIRRYSATKWTDSAAAFVPKIAAPAGVASTIGAAGALVYNYKVTAVATDTLEESLAGAGTTKVITAITKATTCTITSAAHGFANGDEVTISGVVGMTQINGLYATITNVAANTFDLVGVDSSTWTAYASGGTVARAFASITCAVPTTGAPNIVSWTAVSGAVSYNIYRAINGVYGFIGTAQGVSFSDIGYNPATTYTPPSYRNPFVGAGNYPAVVAYYQQRLVLADTVNKPETTWASRIGAFSNFTTSLPTQDDDAITWNMAGRQVQAVRHLVEIGKLISFTDAGIWTMEGDTDGALKPTAVNPRQQGYIGANTVPPVAIQNTAIYVSARGSQVRDLRYDLQVDGYQGRDLTVFAPHLFDGYTIVRMAYQENPHSVLWVVRSDGVLLGLTYVREHEVWAWHRHVTDGLVKDVCVVPEGSEDAVYLIVARTINGVSQRYIERMNSRRVTSVAVDAHFVDAGITVDNRNATATTLALTGGVAWDYTETLTLTASASIFTGGSVGGTVLMTASTGETITLTITGYTSGTVVSVQAAKTVPATLRALATATWTVASKTITGLTHLDGKSVAILADGSVLAAKTVSGGQITLDRGYSVVHVGLPYTARAQTLDLATVQSETLVDKVKVIPRVTLSLKDSRGGWAGSDPAGAVLREVKQTAGTSTYGSAITPYTGTVDLLVDSQWNRTGRVTVEQRDPLPMTLLAIVPRTDVGGT